MRAPRALLLTAALAFTVAGCGTNNVEEIVGPRSSGEPTTASAGNPDDLVVLEDDQNLQTVDNVVPVVQTEAATEPLRAALNAVSEALTTEDLIALNRRADLERTSPVRVAEEYADEKGLGEGVVAMQGTGSVVVGAANFSESQILANLYAIALEGAGFDAEVRNVTNRELYGPALERGELTVFPEYVGTFTEYLNKRQNGPDAEAVASGDLEETVEALRPLAESVGLTVLEPSAAQDQNAFAVTREFAEENGLRTLSDLADYEGELVLGGPPECPERPFCQPGLESTYGIEFDDFVSLDAGGPLTKTALKQGRIQVGLVFSSDGSLSTLE
ncbi:MAG TPA: glycine betaine ABC transporter substrate-binding protein [Mycobacteriales bacterium]|nr:glycine betaine ABC transporter substrate-binding protein [Mycobacteriales bacterium]